MEIVIAPIVATEIIFFIYGSFYGFFNLSKSKHWILRVIAGATFFGFFFITIPISYFTNKKEI